jgi:hypothetical protein
MKNNLLTPAMGVINAILFSIPIWAIIVLIIWLFF